MNLKCLSRKRILGIENPQDYIYWAQSVHKTAPASRHVNDLIELNPYRTWQERKTVAEGVIGDSHPAANDKAGLKSQENYDPRNDYFYCPYSINAVMETFDLALEELGLSFDYPATVHTEIAKTVSSIYFQARKFNQYIYSIDIRPFSDLNDHKDIFTVLDEMAVQCGCIPPGLSWSEYLPELGRSTLNNAFAYDLVFSGSRGMDQNAADNLASLFLAHFSESARYFSNCSNSPWDSQGGYGSSPLTEHFVADFGLVVVDEINIGMLVMAGDD